MNLQETIIEHSTSDCCRELIVHADGYFRCSTCGNIIITIIGGVAPDGC